MRDLGRHRMPYDTKSRGECQVLSGPVSYVVMFGLRLGFFLLFPKRSKKIQKV